MYNSGLSYQAHLLRNHILFDRYRARIPSNVAIDKRQRWFCFHAKTSQVTILRITWLWSPFTHSCDYFWINSEQVQSSLMSKSILNLLIMPYFVKSNTLFHSSFRHKEYGEIVIAQYSRPCLQSSFQEVEGPIVFASCMEYPCSSSQMLGQSLSNLEQTGSKLIVSRSPPRDFQGIYELVGRRDL